QALNNAASPQLSESAIAKRKRAEEALTARLNLVPVDVSVRFAPLAVSSADLLSLALGDVLLLRPPPPPPPPPPPRGPGRKGLGGPNLAGPRNSRAPLAVTGPTNASEERT